MGMMIHRNRERKREREMHPDELREESSLSFSDGEIQPGGVSEKNKYTRSDIQRMSKAELLEMAKNTGVEGADEMTRAELAEYMLSALGL